MMIFTIAMMTIRMMTTTTMTKTMTVTIMMMTARTKTMTMINNQVTCSPDSKGNFGVVTETFTVGTKSVQVILMLLMLVLISVLMLLAPRKVVKIQCAGDACHQEG